MYKIIGYISKYFLNPLHIFIATMAMIIVGYDSNELLYNWGLTNITIRYPLNFLISYLIFCLISKIWAIYISKSKQQKDVEKMFFSIMTLFLTIISFLVIIYMGVLFLKPLKSFSDIAGQILLGLVIIFSTKRLKQPHSWIKKTFLNTIWSFLGFLMIIIFSSLVINRYYPELTQAKSIVELLPIIKQIII